MTLCQVLFECDELKEWVVCAYVTVMFGLNKWVVCGLVVVADWVVGKCMCFISMFCCIVVSHTFS